jgi:hypothetical protein
MGGHVAVLGFKQHIAGAVDQHGAKRMVAVRQGAAGDREGAAQKRDVALGAVAAFRHQ